MKYHEMPNFSHDGIEFCYETLGEGPPVVFQVPVCGPLRRRSPPRATSATGGRRISTTAPRMGGHIMDTPECPSTELTVSASVC